MQYVGSTLPLKPSFKLKFDSKPRANFEVYANYVDKKEGSEAGVSPTTDGVVKSAAPVITYESNKMNVQISFEDTK